MAKSIDNTGVLLAQAPPPQSLFTNQQPDSNLTNASDNGTNYELGMKFQSARAGQITAIRYLKAPSETGTHVGRIWSSNGTCLVSVTFSNETASGWQQQALSTPLNIQANTTYLVSVNCNGYFVDAYNGLGSSIVNGDLSSVAGNNGVFGNPGSFPTNSYQSSNYFRDVVFVAAVPATIIKVSGDNQTGAAGTALPNPLVVQVNGTDGNPQSGTTVNFAITSGSGSISPPSAVTNTQGQASTVLTLGTTTGTITVSATASGVGSVSFSASTNSATSNPITLENQKTGTTDWKITNQGTTEIAGYAAATSVNRGGTLDIKVALANTTGNFTIDVYRLGYYQGMGGRKIGNTVTCTGVAQPNFTFDTNTRLYECNWSTSYTLQVGNDWTTGLYIAKLTDQTTSKQSQVWFVVRDDSSTADILFQSSFNTYLAYNNTGGYSLYEYSSNNKNRAFKVSYDRPFSMTTTNTIHYDLLTRWERHMVCCLESQGYNVSYVTNVDVHTNSNNLLQKHKVFMSVGHDEYWSMEQRQNVENALKAGVNLCFFSANTCYWRVRFEKSSAGVDNRVMVCYKNAPDPMASTDLTKATNKFRNIGKPENALIGVMYVGDKDELYDTWDNPSNPYFGGWDFVVKNSNHRYYAHTNLNDGDTLNLLVGFEVDGNVPQYTDPSSNLPKSSPPSGLVVLSESPITPTVTDTDLPPGTSTQLSHAVCYTAPSGAKVFSTGSIHWMRGLDNSNDNNPPTTDTSAKQIATKQITVNVLADMGVKPLTPDPNIIVPS